MKYDFKWLVCIGILIAGATSVASTATAANGGKYNNPFIFDGTMEESPLNLEFEISEIRTRFNDYDQNYIDHYVPRDYEALVADLQNRYKTSKPLSPTVNIIGYIFLTQQNHWAFTLREQGTNVEYVMEVMPNPSGKGAIIALLGRKFGVKNAAYKRSWLGSSPASGKKHSVKVGAY